MRRVMTSLAVNLCRIAVALTFIFSGYVKAIDPLGTQYKIIDYLEVLGLAAYIPEYVSLTASILLGGTEFCLGIMLLFAIRRHTVTRLLLLFMAIMTPLTLWLALDNPIEDCGCFGDAIVLTNWETFIKNAVITAAVVVIYKYPLKMPRFISRGNQWIVVTYTIVFILFSSSKSLYTLPPFDFRPYHIGADIKKGMEMPEDALPPRFETTFIMEKNGQRKEFTINDYPDSTWTYIESKTIQTEKGYIPPIHDFSIQTADSGEDITDSILNRSGYSFILVSPRLEDADDSNFGDIDRIHEYCKEHDYPFYALTASTDKAVRHWRDITGAEYNFYITDETTLKTIIRSNPGLLLIKKGTVIGKWSHNTLPELELSSPKLEKTVYGHIPEDSTAGKISKTLIWYILPLLILTFVDRTWNFTKWIRNNKKYNAIFNFLKGKKK